MSSNHPAIEYIKLVFFDTVRYFSYHVAYMILFLFSFFVYYAIWHFMSGFSESAQSQSNLQEIYFAFLRNDILIGMANFIFLSFCFYRISRARKDKNFLYILQSSILIQVILFSISYLSSLHQVFVLSLGLGALDYPQYFALSFLNTINSLEILLSEIVRLSDRAQNFILETTFYFVSVILGCFVAQKIKNTKI